jgi:predicted Zn-dependent protease
MFTRDQAQKLAEKILSYSTFPECAVTLGSSEDLNIRFANNGITTSGFTVERTLVISSTRDQKTGATRTDSIDDDALRAAVKRSEELAGFAPANPEHMPPLGPQPYPALANFAQETARARAPEIIPHIRAIIAAATKERLVAAGFFERSAETSALANKKGLFGYHRSTDSRLSTTIRTPDGSSSGWAAQPAVRVSELDGAALAAVAVEKCLRWRKPVRLEPGKYTVVLEAAASGDLLRMAAFSFSARMAEEGRSFLSKPAGGTLLGEKLFPEMVTLRSDPFDTRLPSPPWSLDFLPTRKMTWIDQGVVRNLYYDRYWAQKAGNQPTPFPGSMLLEGAEASLEDLVASVERGLLVTHFWYIRVLNPKTLQLTGLTRDGLFLIEKGKISNPVVNFRFNESPVRLLQNVRRLGRPMRVRGLEGGSMIAPPLVSSDFTFSSISDAV